MRGPDYYSVASSEMRFLSLHFASPGEEDQAPMDHRKLPRTLPAHQPRADRARGETGRRSGRDTGPLRPARCCVPPGSYPRLQSRARQRSGLDW